MGLPTYDPTNYGNEPGDGALRIGGQQVNPDKITGTDTSLPSTRSKASKRQIHAAQRARDLWEGQDRVHERGATYLPRNVMEDAASYNARIARTPFHNFFRRAVEGMVGLVYRTDPVIGEDVPEQIVEHLENIDMAGTHFDVFARNVSTDAMVVGHAAILVEYPMTGGRQTAADEMMGTVRPYWVPIQKEQILSWRCSVQGGATVLDQIVLHEKHMLPDGDYGEKEVDRYRVLKREGGNVTFTVYEIDNRKVRVATDGNDNELKGVYGRQTKIPITEVATSGRKGLFESDPPLNDVAHLNIAYYQQYSDLVESQHKTVPFLLTLGLPSHDEMGNPIDEIAVGPTTGINITDPSGDARYVSHDGSALSDMKATLDELKGDIGSLSLAMLSPQKRIAETAEAKRLDKAQSDSALAVTARAWQDAFERALEFHATYMGLDSGGSIQINRDFEGLVMEADVMRAYADLVKAGFPQSIALEMLQQGGRIPADVDLEELEREMLAQQAANEAMRTADVEERLSALTVMG